MELSTTIIGLLLLALFIFPIIMMSRSGKSKGKKFEKDFFSEVSINKLKISDKDLWSESAIGIDTEKDQMIYIDWSGSQKVSNIFELKSVKVFEPIPSFAEQNKKNFNITKVSKLGLRFSFKEAVKPDINITFYIAGLGQITDEEINLFKKWQSVIKKKLDTKAIDDIKHTA